MSCEHERPHAQQFCVCESVCVRGKLQGDNRPSCVWLETLSHSPDDSIGRCLSEALREDRNDACRAALGMSPCSTLSGMHLHLHLVPRRLFCTSVLYGTEVHGYSVVPPTGRTDWGTCGNGWQPDCIFQAADRVVADKARCVGGTSTSQRPDAIRTLLVGVSEWIVLIDLLRTGSRCICKPWDGNIVAVSVISMPSLVCLQHGSMTSFSWGEVYLRLDHRFIYRFRGATRNPIAPSHRPARVRSQQIS